MASIGDKVYLYGGANSIYSDAWVLHSLRGEDAAQGIPAWVTLCCHQMPWSVKPITEALRECKSFD